MTVLLVLKMQLVLPTKKYKTCCSPSLEQSSRNLSSSGLAVIMYIVNT